MVINSILLIIAFFVLLENVISQISITSSGMSPNMTSKWIVLAIGIGMPISSLVSKESEIKNTLIGILATITLLILLFTN